MIFSKCFLLGAALSLVPLALPAAPMRVMPLTELSQSADLIVLGTVQSKTTLRDDAGRIYTKVTLSVSEVWKGTTTNTTLSICHGGGTLGDERVEVSDQVEYTVGEEVAAFLVFNPHGDLITRALGQGKFHIWSDPQTGEKLARNIFHGADRSTTNAAPFALGNPTHPQRSRLTLNDLKQAVKEAKP